MSSSYLDLSQAAMSKTDVWISTALLPVSPTQPHCSSRCLGQTTKLYCGGPVSDLPQLTPNPSASLPALTSKQTLHLSSACHLHCPQPKPATLLPYRYACPAPCIFYLSHLSGSWWLCTQTQTSLFPWAFELSALKPC